MRKVLLAVAVVVMFFQSCTKSAEEAKPKGKKFTAKLGINYNFITDEGEITGAGETGTEGKLKAGDLVAIKIYNSSDDQKKGDLYAAGLYKGEDLLKDEGLSLEMEHGKKYFIRTSVFRNEGINLSIGADLKEENGVYTAPLGVALSRIADDNKSCSEIFKENAASYGVMKLAGQVYEKDLSAGDRFIGEQVITADYAQESYTISAKRAAIKLKLNVQEYYEGHTVKLYVFKGKIDELPSDVEPLSREIKYDNGGEMSLNVEELTLHYPEITDNDNVFACPNTKITIVAAVYDGVNGIKVLKKEEMEVTNNHIYTININANPSKEQGIVVTLDEVWEDAETSVDLEEIETNN